MKRMTLRMSDELAEKLVKQASENTRSLHGEIIHTLEGSLVVSIVGKVRADGTVEFNNDYRNTPEGIEQSR